jgi:hypothetical protein
MHSHWIDRLFGQMGGSHQGVAANSMGIVTAVPIVSTSKKRSADISRATRPKPFARICLGIGDGAVHRQ